MQRKTASNDCDDDDDDGSMWSFFLYTFGPKGPTKVYTYTVIVTAGGDTSLRVRSESCLMRCRKGRGLIEEVAFASLTV